jgi:hypothetical protein
MVVSKNKHCNFRKPIILKKDDSSKQISNKYLYDSLLIFIYSIYLFTYKELKRDFKKQLLTKSIVSFVSEGEIYQNIKIFSKLEPLFDLFEKLRSNTSNPQQDLFIEMINSFYDKNSNNLTWKNELSKLILDFRTIVALLEEYYGAICMRDNYVHYFLITFLEIYMKELNIMKVEIVEKCKTMGNLIGNLCFVKNDKGILYSLRNTRNRIDFLKLLSDIQFRLEITYSEQFFLDLPDEPEWIETKSLITIFAMNSFLYKQNKKGELNHG